MNRSNKQKRPYKAEGKQESLSLISTYIKQDQLKTKFKKSRFQDVKDQEIMPLGKIKKIRKASIKGRGLAFQKRTPLSIKKLRLPANRVKSSKTSQQEYEGGIQLQIQVPIKQSLLEHSENYLYAIKLQSTKQIERKEIPEKKWTRKLVEEHLKQLLDYILEQLGQQLIKQVNPIIIEHSRKKTRVSGNKKQFISKLALQASQIFNSFKSKSGSINTKLISFNRMFFPKLNFPPKISHKQHTQNFLDQKTIEEQNPPKYSTPQKHQLTDTSPLCSCGSSLSCRKCTVAQCFKMVVFCDNLNCRMVHGDHDCHAVNEGFNDKIQIIGKGKVLTEKQYNFQTIKSQQKQNNIYETVKNNGYQFINHYKYSVNIPFPLYCQFPIISENYSNLILENRQHQKSLPLEIRKSHIKNAGLGVFAKKAIKANTLVCSYIGQIGISSNDAVMNAHDNKSSKGLNDSIYTIGWVGRELVFIRPSLYSNIGRFINYNDPKRCNLKPNLCLIQNRNKELEVCVFFTTIRKIQQGEQLFYDYGEEYSK